MPKSDSTGMPCALMSTLLVLMSRWMSDDDALAMCGSLGARQIDAEIEHLVGIERGLRKASRYCRRVRIEYRCAEPVAVTPDSKIERM